MLDCVPFLSRRHIEHCDLSLERRMEKIVSKTVIHCWERVRERKVGVYVSIRLGEKRSTRNNMVRVWDRNLSSCRLVLCGVVVDCRWKIWNDPSFRRGFRFWFILFFCKDEAYTAQWESLWTISCCDCYNWGTTVLPEQKKDEWTDETLNLKLSFQILNFGLCFHLQISHIIYYLFNPIMLFFSSSLQTFAASSIGGMQLFFLSFDFPKKVETWMLPHNIPIV